MADSFSFDTEVAAAASAGPYGGAVPIELPADQQRYGTLWPTPADMVSDHSAEGALWQPTARDIPQDPPQGPLWTADHDAPQVEYSAGTRQDDVTGVDIGAPAVPVHDGTGRALPAPDGRPAIGQPFTVNQGGTEVRYLATDQWDATGKRVSPADAPSAPHQLYGSEHFTTPRMIPYEVSALFANEADSNQFPGTADYYWGVNAAMPDMSPRPHGAVSAQPPSDPYVADSVAAAVPVAAAPVDYSTDW
jgi:hypothetical protein